jgi:hypothetical protein
LFRAFPILSGEGINGEHLDAILHTTGQYAPDILGASTVTGEAGEASLLGPSAVAIHNDTEMVGYQIEWEFLVHY